MKSKWIIFVVAVIVLAGLFWWSGQDRQKEAAAPAGMGQMPPSHPTPTGTPLPSVTSAKVAVQGTQDENLGAVDLKWNEPVQLPNTDYTLKMTEFYTHWNWDKHAINISRNESNPAAKVEVYKGGNLQYTAWAFKNVPFFRMTMHQAGGDSTSEKPLAFTLMTYEGLTFPDGGGQGDGQPSHEGSQE